MSGGLVTCVKCEHDWGTLAYRECCGLLWAVCGRCGYGWPQTPRDAQQPAQESQGAGDRLIQSLANLAIEGDPTAALVLSQMRKAALQEPAQASQDTEAPGA